LNRVRVREVDSLGWGGASDGSAAFAGLPHVERTLNRVRIAARFSVRILLDMLPDNLTRFGATAVNRDREMKAHAARRGPPPPSVGDALHAAG
jgi:multidrug resistance efflux pump